MLTKIISINCKDAQGDGCTGKFNVADAADPATFGADLLTKFQAVSALAVTGLQSNKAETFAGSGVVVAPGAGHPYSDGRAWLDMSFLTANPYVKIRFVIPAPKVGVVPEADMMVSTTLPILDAIKAAIIGFVTSDEGEVATELASARILVRTVG